MPKLNHEAVHVYALSDYQTDIERGLKPTAPKDEAREPTSKVTVVLNIA